MSGKSSTELENEDHEQKKDQELKTSQSEKREQIEQEVFNFNLWCDPKHGPVRPHERIPGAPALSVTLECSPTFKPNKNDFKILLRVTYEGIAGPNGSVEKATKPITFRCFSVFGLTEDVNRHGLRLYLRRPVAADDEGDWEECIQDEDGCFRLYDAPDVSASVATDEDFTSLFPGESWTNYRIFDSTLPDKLIPGDVFCCGYKGGLVDWWNWGSSEDHAKTVVQVPSYIAGKVTNPSDNEGRPEIIVPASKPVMFKIVE
ncbi:uncharacterized protein CTRU02_206562 [Colletotrichum truncatum]|uniref:Uncharacterized protein n=1 Tax=Colletotrichum truncatum TaxID=5467 RepID=A0ACC3Z757_COLTU|nr:uncharacterized protein CTRU02_11931 [Colletotrichum truncatum]KAF6785306.1 hypothetical protein CTRU02_11931 [Colletotrichum truncatum]